MLDSGADSAANGSDPQEAGTYQVLARRARPQTFSEVVGQEHVTRTLTNAIASGRLAHAFVFSGMRGVGKTTTARILAKALNCAKGPTPDPCNECPSCREIAEGRSLDVLEVDAASQTGIDATRELLETVKYQPAASRYRVYIIDEAHGLSKQAVDAFLKTLEEPPEHAKFILATTAPQKLTSTVLSRCQRFDFRAVSGDTIVETLAAMVQREGMEADPEALAAIARESGGSLRDATSLLDQVLAFSEGRIDASAVGMALGLPDVAAVRELFAAVVAQDAAAALEVVGRVVQQGTDLTRFAHDVLRRIRNLTVLAVAGPGGLSDLTRHEIEELKEAREGLASEDLQRWFRILLSSSEEVARSAQPRLVLEMAVMRMALLAPLVPLDQLVGRLEALERGAGGGPGGGGGLRPAARGAPRGGRPSAETRPSPRPQPSRPAPQTRGKAESSSGAPSAADPTVEKRPRRPIAPMSPSADREVKPRAPKPAETSPSPSATTKSVDEATQKNWESVVDALQRQQTARFFRLAYSEVLEVGEGRLRVRVTGRNAEIELMKPDTRKLIEQELEKVYGEPLAFEAVPADPDGPSKSGEPVSLERRGREDPVVKMSVEVLEGKVEGVVARGRRDGT